MISDTTLIANYVEQSTKIAEKSLFDDNKLCLHVINMIDAICIPYFVSTGPRFLQQVITSLISNLRLSKQSYMQVRDKYKTVLLLLYDGKNEQAVAYMKEPLNKYSDMLGSYNAFQISSAFRSVLVDLLKALLEAIPQFVPAYVAMRSNLWTLAMTKAVTNEKAYDILESLIVQLNEALMPALLKFLELSQKVFSLVPELQSKPAFLQSFTEMSLKHSNLNITHCLTMVHSYISQQNTLPKTIDMCNIL